MGDRSRICILIERVAGRHYIKGDGHAVPGRGINSAIVAASVSVDCGIVAQGELIG